jgi:hypothetical protein
MKEYKSGRTNQRYNSVNEKVQKDLKVAKGEGTELGVRLQSRNEQPDQKPETSRPAHKTCKREGMIGKYCEANNDPQSGTKAGQDQP